MKNFLCIAWMMLLSFVGYAQLNVESTFLNNSNILNCQYLFPPNQDVSEDLFFSIGPSGLPQYGQNVAWNLSPGTIDKARFYHVKKGDWDRSAIRTDEEVILFSNSEIINPVEETPNINMKRDWIKLGQSWNLARDNYAIAIVSFTNHWNANINKGTIKFSHPDVSHIEVQEIYIYNQWLQLISSDIVAGRKVYEFEYFNLAPREIRHLYLKVNIRKYPMSQVPDIDLRVEMVGFQSDEIRSDGTIPPHDPNALYLLNAFENTTPISSCGVYSAHPELENACNNGDLFWIWCPDPNDYYCPLRLKYSLDYPYCNQDSEIIKYRINCLNDGAGFARHVQMLNSFDVQGPSISTDIGPADVPPFEVGNFDYFSSHDVTGEFNYPSVEFNFNDIYLPGLDDPQTVYTYDECSAQVTFTVKTLCDIDKIINAKAEITFYDTNENAVDAITTNHLNIVPEQGEYNNYEPQCISCNLDERNFQNPSNTKEISMISGASKLEVSFERDRVDELVSLYLVDISGQLLLSQTIGQDGNLLINEDIDISNFTSGIYFLSIQIGDRTYNKKFVRY